MVRAKCRGPFSKELDSREARLMRDSIEDDAGMIRRLWDENANLKLEIQQLKREKAAILSELLEMQRASHVERGSR